MCILEDGHDESPAGDLSDQEALAADAALLDLISGMFPTEFGIRERDLWRQDCAAALLASDWLRARDAARDAEVERRAARKALLGAADWFWEPEHPGSADNIRAYADEHYPEENA